MMVPLEDFLHAQILVVDSREANIRLFESLLKEAGYANVVTTTDAQAVCALHQRRGFDLILLDLQMPGMDGYQVMEALTAQNADAYLPVIAFTAQPEHKVRALQAGAKDFISKPFDLVEVKTRIHNMLEVRLLYKRLENHSRDLEQTVREQTAELRASEARYRCLTDLAVDWYWEQDADGGFTQVCGPVPELLGIAAPSPPLPACAGAIDWAAGWNAAERAALQMQVRAHQPFLDLMLSRVNADGSRQWFRVSGEPMFGHFCRLVGYRGIAVEVNADNDGLFARQQPGVAG